jgi:magnesium-transporting ATPase (P-type)
MNVGFVVCSVSAILIVLLAYIQWLRVFSLVSGSTTQFNTIIARTWPITIISFLVGLLLARFLGTSPATLRKWERQGLVSYPRVGTDRRFDTKSLAELADTVRSLGRISENRRRLILSSLTILDIIENENRNHRTS